MIMRRLRRSACRKTVESLAGGRRAVRAVAALGALLLVSAAPADWNEAAWVSVWTAAQVGAGPADLLEPLPAVDHTLRQIVHATGAGTRIRIRLSNAFGRTPLRVAAAHVARALRSGDPHVVPGTDRAVTFGGRSEVTVAPGSDIWSDSVDLDVPALSSITISLHIPNGPDRATGHGDARATSFLAAGDQSASQGLRDAKPIGHWYYLSAVAISGGTASGTVVALGDSITDSYMSTVHGNGPSPTL